MGRRSPFPSLSFIIHRSTFCEVLCNLDGILGGHADIIHGGPNPERVGIRRVVRDLINQDIARSRRINRRGRRLAAAPHAEVFSSQSGLRRFGSDRLGRLCKNRERQGIEHRDLGDFQSRNRKTSRQVAPDLVVDAALTRREVGVAFASQMRQHIEGEAALQTLSGGLAGN